MVITSLVASVALAGTFAALPPAAQEAPSADDRLYGRVITASGDVFEGFIRWDRNEGSWADLLTGSKELPFRNLREAEELTDYSRDRDENEIEIFGLRITWSDDDDHYPDRAESGIRFGHLGALEVLDDDRVLLELKSGAEVELAAGSTDVGDGNRGIEVVDAERGSVELRWRDLDRIEFRRAPADATVSPDTHRLHGTLRTRDGREFTGYVAWDVDEILTSDVLDGEDRGRDREIPFGRIAAIERESSSAARVVLRNGDEVELRGSNDVNDSNRGISISEPALGQVMVEWDDFGALTFHPPAEPTGYDAFDGGGPLYGTVASEDGDEWTGRIRWDNDEEYGWEILDGRDGDMEFEVEFSRISSIRKRFTGGAEVYLRDGRVLELDDSNDVDRGNKGIFVTTEDGETVAVSWNDFEEVSFRAPPTTAAARR